MIDSAYLAEAMLRGFAIGALVATAISLWRAAPGRPAGLAAAGMCLTTAAYLVEGLLYGAGIDGPVFIPVHVLSLSGAGFAWLFIGVIFEDWRIGWLRTAPALGLTALGLAGFALWPGPAASAIFVAHNIAEAALGVHALALILRGWSNDLVEARRRVRGPFFAAVAGYTLVQAGIEGARFAGADLDGGILNLVGAVAMAALTLGGAVIFLRADPSFVAPSRIRLPEASAPPGPDPAPDPDPAPANAADRLEIGRLLALVDGEEAWRRESLSLTGLAQELRIPEHRLRRLINDQLGARNFSEFINTRRIAEARRLLADPAEARRTVSAIAFELGFGSLGPFNRAFKADTGQTPTDFRRTAMAEPSPKPENTG